MDQEGKSQDRIEALKQKIYMAKDDVVRKTKEGVLHAKTITKVPDTWAPRVESHIETTTNIMSKPSMFKKFFIISFIFFLGAVGFAFYMFFNGGNTVSNSNIDIEILGNAFTRGGEDLSLQVSVTNKNAVPLELADLIIEYPKGSDTSTLEHQRLDIGTVAPGKTIAQNFTVVLYGEQGIDRNIKATLEYRVKGSNAIFTKEYAHAVKISDAPLVLSVESPTGVSSNQEFIMRFKIAANSSKSTDNLMLQVVYPTGFIFKSAAPSPDLSNNLWQLGALGPGGQKTIEVHGMIIGGDGDEKTFHAYAGTKDARDEQKIAIIYNSLLQTVAVQKPFVQAVLKVNNQSGESVVVGNQGKVDAEIRWSNNLPTQVDNLEIHAHFSGPAFNENTVDSNSGFYNSIADEIVWDKNSNSDFVSVSPGEEGTLTFSFTPKSDSGGTLLSDPTLTLEVSVKGSQPGQGNILQEISSVEKTVVKISSSFQLAGKVLHSIGAFQNTGTLPPKAEQTTSYTVVWTGTNSSNRINQAEARATLPTYVKWVGQVSPQSENLTYLPATREVVWKIGTINQGVGFSSAAREVSFQIEITPSLSQVGSVPTLVNDTVISGVDQFTGATMRATKPKLDTRLSQDPGFASGNEIVIR